MGGRILHDFYFLFIVFCIYIFLVASRYFSYNQKQQGNKALLILKKKEELKQTENLSWSYNLYPRSVSSLRGAHCPAATSTPRQEAGSRFAGPHLALGRLSAPIPHLLCLRGENEPAEALRLPLNTELTKPLSCCISQFLST